MHVFPACSCPPLGKSHPPPGFDIPPEGPLGAEPRCLGLTLTVIREHAWGAEASYIARAVGLKADHVKSALVHLDREGFVISESVTISWYYKHRTVHLWREAFRPDLLGQPLPSFSATPEEEDGIPPQFWWIFWSGMDPMFLRLSQHALYIASRMVAPQGSPRFLPAETWALDHLPTWELRSLAEVRGYNSCPAGERIRRHVSRREACSGPTI